MAQHTFGAYLGDRSPSFFGRLHKLLAATDQAICWYGAHRAWPANEPVRIERQR